MKKILILLAFCTNAMASDLPDLPNLPIYDRSKCDIKDADAQIKKMMASKDHPPEFTLAHARAIMILAQAVKHKTCMPPIEF